MSGQERTPESLGYSERDCNLVREWHSTVPAHAIAKDYGLGERQVRNVWSRAISDGLLPTTPRHVVAEPLISGADDFSPDLAAGDALLAALRREHGNDPRRAGDDVAFSDRWRPHSAGFVAIERARRDVKCIDLAARQRNAIKIVSKQGAI